MIASLCVVSDVNQACAGGALMFKWSRWRMKAVGGKHLSLSLRCSFPLCLCQPNLISRSNTPQSCSDRTIKKVCVFVCVWFGGSNLTLKNMVKRVSLFRSVWIFQRFLGKCGALFVGQTYSFIWVTSNISSSPMEKRCIIPLNHQQQKTTTKKDL